MDDLKYDICLLSHNSYKLCCKLIMFSLFCFKGCISVDEGGNRLFLSDSNHHRLIIFAGNGKILDCVCVALHHLSSTEIDSILVLLLASVIWLSNTKWTSQYHFFLCTLC